VLGERNPVKVTDQKALEPSVPPPNPSRPRYVLKYPSASLYLHLNFGKRRAGAKIILILMPAPLARLEAGVEGGPRLNVIQNGIR
jgi:hypothetical protein